MVSKHMKYVYLILVKIHIKVIIRHPLHTLARLKVLVSIWKENIGTQVINQ